MLRQRKQRQLAEKLFDLPSFQKSADFAIMLRTQFPKVCAVCKTRYTFKQWQRLPNPRLWKLPWGGVQELRECTCLAKSNTHPTLSVVLVEGDPE